MADENYRSSETSGKAPLVGYLEKGSCGKWVSGYNHYSESTYCYDINEPGGG
jgi:hypothetical protein